MAFNETFKKYRIECGYTQEEIANLLMVTPQAVSKWETAASTPDISMLIPIAHLFDITVDELLGNNVKNRDEMIEEVMEVIEENGDLQSRYESLTNALKRNPTNSYLMTKILECIKKILRNQNIATDDEAKCSYILEAEELTKRLRNKSDSKRYHDISYCILYEIYIYAGEFERAEELIQYIPFSRFNRLSLLGKSMLLQDKLDESREAYGVSVINNLIWMLDDLLNIGWCYRKKNDYDGCKTVLKLSYDLIHQFYGDCKYPAPISEKMLYIIHSLASYCEHDEKIKLLNEFVEMAEVTRRNFGIVQETGCFIYPKLLNPYNRERRRNLPSKEWVLWCLEKKSFEDLRENKQFQTLLQRVREWE